MKKLTLALCAALASSTASADTIFGFDATAGVWQPSYSGGIGVDNFNVDNFSLAEDNVTFLQVALEHPIPLIPNILLAHSGIETDGSTVLNTDVTFGDETFDAGSDIRADIDLTHTDVTLYYEILDNWVNLDVGVTARQYDGAFDLVEQGVVPAVIGAPELLEESIELSGVLPMVYGMARFDLPFTGWSIIAQGNGTGYNGDTHTDFTAKIRWDFVPVVDLAVEAGYRVMSLDVKELDDLQSDIEIKGLYLGLNLHL